jgi:hypothetical protein
VTNIQNAKNSNGDALLIWQFVLHVSKAPPPAKRDYKIKKVCIFTLYPIVKKDGNKAKNTCQH